MNHYGLAVLDLQEVVVGVRVNLDSRAVLQEWCQQLEDLNHNGFPAIAGVEVPA